MKIRSFLFLFTALWLLSSIGFSAQTKIINNDSEKSWWFGVVNHGHLMPLNPGYKANLSADTYGNQAQPLLLSNMGDVIWCEEPPEIIFTDQSITIKSKGIIEQHKSGSTLRDAYQFASNKYFPPSGKLPDSDLFLHPQYNTWIELMYDQNQEDIMDYANAIIANGFPPGVLMIDDNWQEGYGKWDFQLRRFNDPRKMINDLHDMGFKVMLWVCPFISPDSDVYRKLKADGVLLKNKDSLPAMIRWWNGASALLDFSNPRGFEWFDQQLAYLTEQYQVDGFKFDAGDAQYYKNVTSFKDINPNEHSRLFGLFGLKYPLNEYRAMWKMGGQPLAERLRDKNHNWEDLGKLIPHMVIQGLSGYPFSCPDMIGGGEFTSFLDETTIDQELIVRSTQVHALMPMMQFSVAPWRILDSGNLAAVKKAVDLRKKYSGYIYDQAEDSARTNEPIIRSLEYVYPHQGYALVNDQFLLGEKLLVAPILEQGKYQRTVKIPPGQWQDSQGKVFKGPIEITVSAPIDVLPWFKKTE
jgi:alpha-glucosidase (family GH31 glycosyl hydrolase)